MAVARFFPKASMSVGRYLPTSNESIAAHLEQVDVTICLGSGDSRTNRWINEALTNLMGRLYPRIRLQGRLDDIRAASELALSINPALEIARVEGPAHPAGAFLRCERNDQVFGARAWASGWVAGLDPNDAPAEHPDMANPYSAAAAAALASAALFRFLFLGGGPPARQSVSLLDYTPDNGLGEPLPRVDIGETVIAGLGAVGNAALWALSRHEALAGTLELVDHESLEISNIQRYVLSRDSDVGAAKTEIAARELSGSSLLLRPHATTLQEYAATHGMLKTIVVTVDNIWGRRIAQALLPRLVVNGWTGEFSLGSSWHDFRSGTACLACLYHPRGPAPSQTDLVAQALGLEPLRAAALWITETLLSREEVDGIATHLGVPSEALSTWVGRHIRDLYRDVICGAAPITNAALGRIESVPLAHQSFLAGIISAAELIKQLSPELKRKSVRDPLIVWDDLRRPPPKLWTQPRAAVPGCICGDPDFRRVFNVKWERLDSSPSNTT